MLFNLLSGGDNFLQSLYLIFIYAIALFTALPFHEFAHAWMANKLGDPTATYQGRNTLNPFRHFDLLGSICILLTGFGWAKPVPVNARNFRKVTPRTGFALTSLAGPVANVILSIIMLIFAKIVNYSMYLVESEIVFTVLYNAYFIFSTLVSVNIGLAIFNLLPIPPLDGSRILLVILPERTYFKIMQYEQYIFIGLLILMVTGVLSVPLGFLRGLVYSFENLITMPIDLIFKAIIK